MSDPISQLKKDIEQATARTMSGSRDFSWLSQEVSNITDEHVTALTLRHFWGQDYASTTPREHTLDILSRFLHYRNFTDYCTRYNEKRDGGSAYFSNQEVLSAKDIHQGDHLYLQWNPGRECIARYLGNAQFVVETVRKSHLRVDDVFTCYLFVKGEPAYLSDLISHGRHYPLYVIGTMGGFTAQVIQNNRTPPAQSIFP